MKLQIQKGLLEQVLSQMQPFLEKKDISQITSHIYLEATDQLILKATDYETGLKTTLTDLQIIQTGQATANGKKLLDIVRILKEDLVTLQTKESTLHIYQGHSKFKLPMFDPKEYPSFPSTEALPQINVPSNAFVASLKKISPAIDTNNPKFELNGALIDIKQTHINFVATDTRRLALVRLNQSMNEEFHLIIPKKAIMEIQKLFLENLFIFYDQTYLIIKSGGYFFFTKLINGKFPDYERILPKELRYILTLPKDKMIEAIKQITIVSNEILLSFFPDKILFKSLSEENIEAQTELEIQTPFTEEFIMAVNSRYILDFLANMEGEIFQMGINGKELPFELKEDNFITIVMPIMI